MAYACDLSTLKKRTQIETSCSAVPNSHVVDLMEAYKFQPSPSRLPIRSAGFVAKKRTRLQRSPSNKYVLESGRPHRSTYESTVQPPIFIFIFIRVVILIFATPWKPSHVVDYGRMCSADSRVSEFREQFSLRSPQEKKPVEGSDNLCCIPAKQARIPQDTKTETSMQISLSSQADQSF
jgi:hypothetical protein